MTKKSKIILGTILVVAVIVAILLNNKSKMAAQSQHTTITSYAVTVAPVREGNAAQVSSLVGTVVANRDVAVVSEAAGKVVAVHAEIGDMKKKGDVLIQIDDELKRAAFLSAEVNYEKAKKDLERFESLAKEHAVTDQQLEAARLGYKAAEAQYIGARRQYQDTRVTSPINGVVTARMVDIGAMVPQNSIVANVIDLSTLKVKVNVAERDAFRLKIGDPVDITTDVYPGVTFPGKISSISAKADEAHTYPVEVVLANSIEHPLKAGMFARTAFRSQTAGTVTTIPRMALVGSLKDPRVYVVENGVARLRPVVVGSEIGTDLEVLSGVAKGEQVVVNGQINLKDNTSVTIVQ